MSTEAKVRKKDRYGEIYPLTEALQAEQKRQTKDRVCLHCNRSFPSRGPGHRFCNWCRVYLHLDANEDEHLQRPRVCKTGRVDGFSCAVVAGEEVRADGEGSSCLVDEMLLEVRELDELHIVSGTLGAQGSLSRSA